MREVRVDQADYLSLCWGSLEINDRVDTKVLRNLFVDNIRNNVTRQRSIRLKG